MKNNLAEAHFTWQKLRRHIRPPKIKVVSARMSPSLVRDNKPSATAQLAVICYNSALKLLYAITFKLQKDLSNSSRLELSLPFQNARKSIIFFAFLCGMISERFSVAMFTLGDANSLPFSSASGCQEDGSFQAGMRGNTSLQIEWIWTIASRSDHQPLFLWILHQYK